MEKLKILNLNFSFQRAAHYHINGGMLLMGVVLLAMFLANSPWGDIYASFWNYEVHLQIGEFNFFSHNGHHMTLMTFINDALMAVFFFSVGLEIKREILVGELSSFRQALLPIVAACGGMLVRPFLHLSSVGELPDCFGGYPADTLRREFLPGAQPLVLYFLGSDYVVSVFAERHPRYHCGSCRSLHGSRHSSLQDR